jgi:hypothetical protein
MLLLSSFSFAKPTPSGKNNEVSSFLTALKKYASFLLALLSQRLNETVSRAIIINDNIVYVRSLPIVNARANVKSIIPAR